MILLVLLLFLLLSVRRVRLRRGWSFLLLFILSLHWLFTIITKG